MVRIPARNSPRADESHESRFHDSITDIRTRPRGGSLRQINRSRHLLCGPKVRDGRQPADFADRDAFFFTALGLAPAAGLAGLCDLAVNDAADFVAARFVAFGSVFAAFAATSGVDAARLRRAGAAARSAAASRFVGFSACVAFDTTWPGFGCSRPGTAGRGAVWPLSCERS